MALDQYCRAMGRHGCVCTDLHALSWHDPARDELVASHFNRFLGNLIILVPMLLIGHAGTKHGVPFPVLLRSSFGTFGANIPALLRGLVACGWFGIQTWIGGNAIYTLVNVVSENAFAGEPLAVLGINFGQLTCFLAFWAIHVFFIAKGTESIRWLETYAAPFLIAMGLALLGWAYGEADGFGNMLSAPSQFESGKRKRCFGQCLSLI